MKTDTITHFFSRCPRIGAAYVVGTLLCLFAGTASLSAQVYSTANNGYGNPYSNAYGGAYSGAYGSSDALNQPQYQHYQSTVYEPFGSSLPSQISGRRNDPGTTGGADPTNPNLDNGTTVENTDGGLQGGGDPGNPAPVGEAWVMLLFAAMATLVVYLKRKKVGDVIN